MAESLRSRFPMIALSVLLILAGSACSTNETIPSELIVTRDSLGIIIVENNTVAIDRICLISEEPVLSIGKEDGEEPYLLYRVFDSTRLSDGRIAIVNQGSSEIRVFGADGIFSHSFGRKGEGPGEFHGVYRIWTMPGDTLWVGDPRPWRFLIYDSEGSLKRMVSPLPSYEYAPSDMDLLSDGRAVLGRGVSRDSYAHFELEYLQFVIHSISGAAVDTLGAFPNGAVGPTDSGPDAVWVYALFESFSHVAAHEDLIAIGEGAKAEVSVIRAGANRKVVRVIRWTTGDRSISQKHVSLEYERYRERYADFDAPTRKQFLGALMSPERPIRESFPAFKDILYGRDGRLWVQNYQIPGEDALQTWLVFNEEGHFTCQVDLNNDLEIHEVGSDYVLGEEESDIGVERIVMYELSGASPGTDSVSISEDSDD